MRNTRERRERILQHLLSNGAVNVTDLVDEMGVSAVTIRTDLSLFESQGLVTRSYGGATLIRTPPQEQNIRQKDGLNASLKERIGARAAQLVSPGDNIIIDSGTTTMTLARHLHGLSNLTVMTNGLNIAWELADDEGIQLMLTGGLLRRKSYSMLGAQAEACLGAYNFDMLFLGVDGLDTKFGVTTHNELEASLNHKMVDRAKRVIVLTDSTKFDRISLHRIAPLDRIHTVITDSGITQQYREELERLGIVLIVTE